MYKMIDDCVLVDPITGTGDKSDGGIALPDQMKNRPIKGIVVAVGPGMKLESGDRFPMSLKGREIVAFPRKSGDVIYLDGQEFIVIPERYILMVISEPTDEDGDEIEPCTGCCNDIIPAE
jgi:chaperonin GroES